MIVEDFKTSIFKQFEFKSFCLIQYDTIQEDKDEILYPNLLEQVYSTFRKLYLIKLKIYFNAFIFVGTSFDKYIFVEC